MAAITFDTLKFATRLEKAGIPREHAQAEAEALADVFESGAQDLATKADLHEMEGGFKAEIHQLRHEAREMEQRLDGRMREMEQRITTRFERVDGRINEMRAEVNGEFKRIDGRLNLQQWMLALVVAAEVVPLLAKFFGH